MHSAVTRWEGEGLELAIAVRVPLKWFAAVMCGICLDGSLSLTSKSYLARLQTHQKGVRVLSPKCRYIVSYPCTGITVMGDKLDEKLTGIF